MKYYLIGREYENCDYSYICSVDTKTEAMNEYELLLGEGFVDVFIIKGKEIPYEPPDKWYIKVGG